MTTHFLTRASKALLLAGGLFIASPAYAFVEIDIFQGKAVTINNSDGTVKENVIPAESVVPGDTVVYRYIVNNNGDQTAEGVVVNTAIDANMRYVDGSATAYGVEFSADGGTQYGAQQDLQVLDVDGTYRPAQPDDITNIRWRLQHAVEPGRPFAVGFKAILK